MSNIAFIHQNTSEVKQNDPPPPPYGAIDLNKFDRMWINPRNMLKADWLRDAPGDVVRAKLMLTLTAFHEIPAGSVEDRDRVLAHQLWIDLDQWLAIKPAVFDDWEYCSDGRWYVTGEMRDQICEAKQHQDRKADEMQRLRNAKHAKRISGQSSNGSEVSSGARTGASSGVRTEASSDRKVEGKGMEGNGIDGNVTDGSRRGRPDNQPASDANPF